MSPKDVQAFVTHIEKLRDKRLHQERLARARADAAVKTAADEAARADALSFEAEQLLVGIDFFKDKLSSLVDTAEEPEVTV